jgi:hypothetical protein
VMVVAVVVPSLGPQGLKKAAHFSPLGTCASIKPLDF